MEKELILEYQSNCKINLGLRVLNKRNDDFHNLESIFVEINLSDKYKGVRLSNNEVNYIIEHVLYNARAC